MDFNEYYHSESGYYPEYVTQKEMCVILGACKSIAYALQKKNQIPFIYISTHEGRRQQIKTADIQTADMLMLPVPKANFHNVVIKPSQWQQGMVAELAKRAEIIRNGDVNPTVEKDGVFQMADFQNVYDLRKKLIAKGVPAEEIAFIHEANTEVKKKELFAKVRKGQIRVLMGSTQKNGRGYERPRPFNRLARFRLPVAAIGCRSGLADSFIIKSKHTLSSCCYWHYTKKRDSQPTDGEKKKYISQLTVDYVLFN